MLRNESSAVAAAVLKRAFSVILTTAVMLAIPSQRILGQSATDGPQKSPAELARDIAHTVSAFAPKESGVGIKFQYATANENVVEIKYSVTDPVMFARLKAQAASFKGGKISYFCGEGRGALLKQGVIIREITAASDGSDKIEVVVDKAACERIALPSLAQPEILAQLAQSIAMSKNELEKFEGNALLSFGGTTSHEGVVEERVIVADAATFRMNSINLRGVLTGYNCGKYREQILQGVTIRYSFVLGGGDPAENLLIDRSKC
jgi:hypothetical protein